MGPQAAITIQSCFLQLVGNDTPGTLKSLMCNRHVCGPAISRGIGRVASLYVKLGGKEHEVTKAMDILYLWKLTLKEVPDPKGLVEWK